MLLLCSQVSWAETDAEASWENLRTLRAGQQIEVIQSDLRSQRGTFLNVSEEAVSLKVSTDTVSIPREQVMRVSSREKSKRLRNILIGAAAGTAAGFGLGAWVNSKASESGENLGRFIGFLAGVGSGAGIGAAIPGSQTIYRAKPGPRSEASGRRAGNENIGPVRKASDVGAGASLKQILRQGLVPAE